MAMGSWWLYSPGTSPDEQESESSEKDGTVSGHLTRIPTTREDVVFSNKSIDLRSKRAVMKILRFITDYENQAELWEPYSTRPLPDFLTEQFKLPLELHNLFLALTLSPNTPEATTTGFALPRIARHLRSTGKLGAGFSSVIPKWGGLSEIAQVGCRAGAVGGAVYVLGKGIEEILDNTPPELNVSETSTADVSPPPMKTVKLQGGETVSTTWTIGAPSSGLAVSSPSPSGSRLTSIISSPLLSVFPRLAEGVPVPAGAVIIFPSGSLVCNSTASSSTPPVYLVIHSSDTGECPSGQCKFLNFFFYPSHPISHDEQPYRILIYIVCNFFGSLDEHIL
jgi:hypothetical protein